MLFRQNTKKTGNCPVEMSQAFHDIVRFQGFRNLNLFKHAFNVIQNWETNALQFYSMLHIFCKQFNMVV